VRRSIASLEYDMAPRPIGVSFIIAALCFTPLGHAGARGSGVRVAQVSAPAHIEAQTRRDLARAVRRELAARRLERQFRGFTVAPALVEMRRAVKTDSSLGQVSCIVDLAILNADDVLLGSVRGRARGDFGATSRDVIDAAARSAVQALARAFPARESSSD
jgi:hypothetical protein